MLPVIVRPSHCLSPPGKASMEKLCHSHVGFATVQTSIITLGRGIESALVQGYGIYMSAAVTAGV